MICQRDPPLCRAINGTLDGKETCPALGWHGIDDVCRAARG
jgi:hypothetical protein